MRVRGLTRLRRAQRWLQDQVSPRAVILIYHRIIELPSDPYQLAVTPQHFAEHLEILRRYYQPLRLDNLVAALRAGRLPRRAVAVTMDDGYFDSRRYAQPLLELYEVPATVFVISGSVGGAREFWWDELEQLLLQPGTLPSELDLESDGQSYHWNLGAAAQFSAGDWRQNRDWHYMMKLDPTPRHQFFRALWSLLQGLADDARSGLMEQLCAWAGAATTVRPTHRALTAVEVAGLAADGLVEVGAHSVTHATLSRLTPSAQQYQIGKSKADLEEMLGQAVNSFSYPHGQRRDYTATTVSLVAQAGYESACAAFAGTAERGTDHFQLPRWPIMDCDGETFHRQLEDAFNS